MDRSDTYKINDRSQDHGDPSESFRSYGLPKVIVSDNRPGFVCEEFQQFIRMNGIRHIVSSPYHPASNAAAGRAVQVVKQALQKQVLDKDSTSLRYNIGCQIF